MALQAREKIAFLHVTELSIGFNGKLVKATKLELVCSLKREEAAWTPSLLKLQTKKAFYDLNTFAFHWLQSCTDRGRCMQPSLMHYWESLTDLPRPAQLTPS